VRIESIDIGPGPLSQDTAMEAGSKLAGVGPKSYATKARFEPLMMQGARSTELGWGVVHLYRDGEETVGLGDVAAAEEVQFKPDGEMVDTTVLCIPAVPSYMTASDFLGWVGERTREQVSHFRMVMTGRMNRYMMLMKFRDGKEARRWRAEWDGKVFNGMEVSSGFRIAYDLRMLTDGVLQPENCHVMFIKSIVFETPSSSNATDATSSFPDMSHDPFTPTLSAVNPDSTATSFALKPLPPPTPSLVELPTCPVCLERMDDTTGLLTILCQHVFHCACLQKWRGSGCPVCRHVQPANSLSAPFGLTPTARDINLCQVCDCAEDLWICLICGNVGCGRYKGGHAKEHWKETAHNYALEIETQHVWDYAEDVWVHRLIQTKGDGKLVELPSSSRSGLGGGNRDGHGHGHGHGEDDMEMVPRAKLENIGMEYTHLLTSQLESQRVYFEEVLAKAVDKAAASARAAESSAATAESALAKLKELTIEHRRMRDEIIPGLERDRDRMAAKAEKSGELARSMTRAFQEEKQVGKGLMERIGHLNEALERVRKEVRELKEESAELKEQNRDLSFFISSQDKLKGVEGELGEEIREGTVSLPELKAEKGKKGKGKKKGLD
jgi:BRCA1-associated protein